MSMMNLLLMLDSESSELDSNQCSHLSLLTWNLKFLTVLVNIVMKNQTFSKMKSSKRQS